MKYRKPVKSREKDQIRVMPLVLTLLTIVAFCACCSNEPTDGIRIIIEESYRLGYQDGVTREARQSTYREDSLYFINQLTK